MSLRKLTKKISAIPTSDGAGVKLLRSLGQLPTMRLDPFLMLDEFSSTNAQDYLAGFPAHPHRGFETVTYMLEGNMRHQDHLGNEGYLRSGSVQWMTAGRGIIHAEMPQQESGSLRGFQLWINLPAKEKMKPATYQDLSPEAIPTHGLPHGGRVKVIAGCAHINNEVIAGAIQGLSTEPLFLDVALPPNTPFRVAVPKNHNAFVYVYEGHVQIGAEMVDVATVGVLSHGDVIEIEAMNKTRFLLLAALPLNEPIVQYGPFVMNTREEIEQAIADYQQGKLVS